MNYRMILYILRNSLFAEAVLMLLPAAVAVIYGENPAPFLITIGILLGAAALLNLLRPRTKVIYAREGFISVALSWIMLSAFGALPFIFSGAIPNFIDAIFETVSGFTTTGATILKDIEVVERGVLFWRSFTHWIGGMGVLVFIMAVIPLAEGRSMHIMRAEVPGPSVGKLVPRARNTAKILYGIYILLTVAEIIFLVAGGMPLFDSLVHAFGTAGTGGLSIKNASIAAYDSVYIHMVIAVFMLLFGINFNLYYLLILGRLKTILRNEEVRWYIGIVAVSVLLITANIIKIYGNVGEAFEKAFFQVSSIITTTGYTTADFNLWPELSKLVLVMLMVVGACAGSTGGGIKVARLIILVKTTGREIKRLMHPHSVSAVKLDGKAVDDFTCHGTCAFFILYMLITAASMLLISVDGQSFDTTTTAVIACIGNIGPGLESVGPIGNFSMFSDFSKIILSFDMLLGRLEIFPIIMLFRPAMWKRS